MATSVLAKISIVRRQAEWDDQCISVRESWLPLGQGFLGVAHRTWAKFEPSIQMNRRIYDGGVPASQDKLGWDIMGWLVGREDASA
jgi:hypothetical protein